MTLKPDVLPIKPLAPTAPTKPGAPVKPATPTAETAKRDNPYAAAYANFIEQTKDHVLTVRMDDGLNRHMRVGEPGTGMWSWNVITWPGYLITVGDIADGYSFSRIADMIDFFDREGHQAYFSDGSPSIDFRYWAEKLTGGRSHDVKEFSSKIFLQHVSDSLEEDEDLGTEAQDEYEKIVEVAKRVCARNNVDYDDYLVDLAKRESALPVLPIDDDSADEAEYFGMPIPTLSPAERREGILGEARLYSEDEHEAHEWLRGNQALFGEDAYWDWSMTDYNVHFIFACYAIELTVRLWREYEKSNDAKALLLANQETDRALGQLARSRVDETFKITSHGKVGELSNGALLLKLAAALDQQISARPAYVPQPEPEQTGGDGYVLVEGGLVQNDPVLPVFDLDVLNDKSASAALDLYERIATHPQASTDLDAAQVRIAAFVREHGDAADIQALDALEATSLAV